MEVPPDPVWDLILAGRYEEAWRLHQEQGRENALPDRLFLTRGCDILCCLGRFEEATQAIKEADRLASEEHPGFRLLGHVAVTQWLASDAEGAMESLESCIAGLRSGKIGYSDGIGGGDVALLSFAIAVLEKAPDFRALALGFLEEMPRYPPPDSWPVPLCRFALGRLAFPEVLQAASGWKSLRISIARSRKDVLIRRQVAQALFYRGIERYDAEDWSPACELFEGCVRLNCPIDEEWHLARALAERLRDR